MVTLKQPRIVLSEEIIRIIIRLLLEETAVLTNTERPVHHSFICLTENIDIVSESEDANVRIPRRPEELGLS